MKNVIMFSSLLMIFSCSYQYDNSASLDYNGEYKLLVALPDSISLFSYHYIPWKQGKDKYSDIRLLSPNTVFISSLFDRSKNSEGCTLYAVRPYSGLISFIGERNNSLSDTFAFSCKVYDPFFLMSPQYCLLDSSYELSLNRKDTTRASINYVQWTSDTIIRKLPFNEPFLFYTTKAGQLDIEAEIHDSAGNRIKVTSYSTLVFQRPLVTVSALKDSIYINSSCIINLSAFSDSLRTIKIIYTQFDTRIDSIQVDSSRFDTSYSVILSRVGLNTIYAWAIDDLGNVSEKETVKIVVNPGLPLLSRKSSTSRSIWVTGETDNLDTLYCLYDSIMTVNMMGQDNGSVQFFHWDYLNNDTIDTVTITGDLNIPFKFEGIVRVFCEDNEGNISEPDIFFITNIYFLSTYIGDYSISPSLYQDTLEVFKPCTLSYSEGADKYYSIDCEVSANFTTPIKIEKFAINPFFILYPTKPSTGITKIIGTRPNGIKDTVFLKTVVRNPFSINSPLYCIVQEEGQFSIKNLPQGLSVVWQFDSFSDTLNNSSSFAVTPTAAGIYKAEAKIQDESGNSFSIFSDSIPVFSKPEVFVSEIKVSKHLYEFKVFAVSDTRRKIKKIYFEINSKRDSISINTSDIERTIPVSLSANSQTEVKIWVSDDLSSTSSIYKSTISNAYRIYPILSQDTLKVLNPCTLSYSEGIDKYSYITCEKTENFLEPVRINNTDSFIIYPILPSKDSIRIIGTRPDGLKDTVFIKTIVKNPYSMNFPLFCIEQKEAQFFIGDLPQDLSVFWRFSSFSDTLNNSTSFNVIPTTAGIYRAEGELLDKLGNSYSIFSDSIPVFSKPEIIVSKTEVSRFLYEFKISANSDDKRRIKNIYYEVNGKQDSIRVNASGIERTISLSFSTEGQQVVKIWVSDDFLSNSSVYETSIVVDFERPILKRIDDNNSNWIPSTLDSYDTLLYHFDSSVIVRMSAQTNHSIKQFNWDLGNNGTIDYITKTGVLVLNWKYQGIIKVTCTDEFEISSLSDSFYSMNSSAPGLPNIYVMRVDTLKMGVNYTSYKIFWRFDGYKKEETDYSYDIWYFTSENPGDPGRIVNLSPSTVQNSTEAGFWYIYTTPEEVISTRCLKLLFTTYNIRGYSSTFGKEYCF